MSEHFLNKFPHELRIVIFENIEQYRDLCEARLVCKEWNTVIENVIWRKLFFDECQEPIDSLKAGRVLIHPAFGWLRYTLGQHIYPTAEETGVELMRNSLKEGASLWAGPYEQRLPYKEFPFWQHPITYPPKRKLIFRMRPTAWSNKAYQPGFQIDNRTHGMITFKDFFTELYTLYTSRSIEFRYCDVFEGPKKTSNGSWKLGAAREGWALYSENTEFAKYIDIQGAFNNLQGLSWVGGTEYDVKILAGVRPVSVARK